MKALAVGKGLTGGYQWVELSFPEYQSVRRTNDPFLYQREMFDPMEPATFTVDRYLPTDLVTWDFTRVLTLDGKEADLELAPVPLYRDQGYSTVNVQMSDLEADSFKSKTLRERALWQMAAPLLKEKLENPAQAGCEWITYDGATRMRGYAMTARGRKGVAATQSATPAAPANPAAA